MKYLTKFKLFEDNEIDELDDYITSSLKYAYGEELIIKMKQDIQFVNDKCLELDDEGYFTYCDFTPMTYSKKSDNPIIFLDISGDNFHSFYGNIKQRKEMVDSFITDIINYMKEEGYKEIGNFTFLNNPTSYQLRFEKINY